MDLIRSAKRTRMRLWKDSAYTVPVQWYFVPRDRPFLPLKDGWLFWDSERDPENEGIRRATGELHLGEDYLTDPTWTDGTDPTAVRFIPGRFCGTQDEWVSGAAFPPLVPETFPPVPPPPPDCCYHGFNCIEQFALGAPPVVRSDFVGAGFAFPPAGLREGFAPVHNCFFDNDPVPPGQPHWFFRATTTHPFPRPRDIEYTVGCILPGGAILFLASVALKRATDWYGQFPFVLPVTPGPGFAGLLPATITLTGDP